MRDMELDDGQGWHWGRGRHAIVVNCNPQELEGREQLIGRESIPPVEGNGEDVPEANTKLGLEGILMTNALAIECLTWCSSNGISG